MTSLCEAAFSWALIMTLSDGKLCVTFKDIGLFIMTAGLLTFPIFPEDRGSWGAGLKGARFLGMVRLLSLLDVCCIPQILTVPVLSRGMSFGGLWTAEGGKLAGGCAGLPSPNSGVTYWKLTGQEVLSGTVPWAGVKGG